MAQPAPVTVHCAAGVLCPPYSRGNRYCRSAEQKCDDAAATVLLAAPESTRIPDIIRDRAIVEHAPYNPEKGIFKSRIPKDEPIH